MNTQTFTHVSSTGAAVAVYTNGVDRWYYEAGRQMMLPAIPNRDHGRYFAAVIAGGVTLRREYRQLHDDWMLPTSDSVAQFDRRHAVRVAAEAGDPQVSYETMGERRLNRFLRTGI